MLELAYVPHRHLGRTVPGSGGATLTKGAAQPLRGAAAACGAAFSPRRCGSSSAVSTQVMLSALSSVAVLATSALHAFAATALNQHWRTPYVHVPMCGGSKGACGRALPRGQGRGGAALPLSPYYT